MTARPTTRPTTRLGAVVLAATATTATLGTTAPPASAVAMAPLVSMYWNGKTCDVSVRGPFGQWTTHHWGATARGNCEAIAWATAHWVGAPWE